MSSSINDDIAAEVVLHLPAPNMPKSLRANVVLLKIKRLLKL